VSGSNYAKTDIIYIRYESPGFSAHDHAMSPSLWLPRDSYGPSVFGLYIIWSHLEQVYSCLDKQLCGTMNPRCITTASLASTPKCRTY
jgi:hypothetical protein